MTGAFDDASASMLGGVTVTDNETDELLARDELDWHALVFTPPERAYSADADVSACERIAPMADLVAELALEGRYGEAMTVNGFAFCGRLAFDRADDRRLARRDGRLAVRNGAATSQSATAKRSRRCRSGGTNAMERCDYCKRGPTEHERYDSRIHSHGEETRVEPRRR